MKKIKLTALSVAITGLLVCAPDITQESFSIEYGHSREFHSYYYSGDNGNTVVNAIVSYSAEVYDNNVLTAEDQYRCSAFYFKRNTGVTEWQYLFSLSKDEAVMSTVVKRGVDSLFVACGDSLFVSTFEGLVGKRVLDSLMFPDTVPFTPFTAPDTSAIMLLNEHNNWYKTFTVWKSEIDSMYGE